MKHTTKILFTEGNFLLSCVVYVQIRINHSSRAHTRENDEKKQRMKEKKLGNFIN